MAWETQGPVADRGNEHLGESDRGVILFRKLLRDEILAVQNGKDPVGVRIGGETGEMIRLIPEGYTAFSSTAQQG